MKQKVIIKLTNQSAELMKIVALCNGVETVALKGDGRDMIEIIGEGIDTVKIAKMLRKKMIGRRARLLSVGPAKNEVQPLSTSGINEVQESSTNGINEGSMVVMQLPEPVPYPETPSYPVYETLDYDPHCNVMLIAVCIFPLISLLISLAKEMLTF